MTKIDQILERMTLEEKAALCTGATAWSTTALERLGLPPLVVADGPHGVRRVADADSMAIGALPATCFPTASSTASSWDPGLLAEMGRAIATEAIALGVDVVLGPGVNIKRTPLCGRNFEYFSEDPFLAGELAVGFIDGVQSQGIGTSLKHLAVNNQETRRMTVSAEVDERTLREIYLPAFEAAVTRSQPWTVMSSYNRVNGTYASEHGELQTEILRDEWGFEGFVVSDWGAVHDRPAALQAGLDLEMPGPRPRRVQAVLDAVRDGGLHEAVLDRAVRRIIGIALRAAETPKGAQFDAVEHHLLARRIAARGMVLLKNEGILPLRAVGRIAVIGSAAKDPHIQGGGSSHMTPTRVDVPIDELEAVADAAEVTYAQGYPDDDQLRADLIEEAVANARAADVAVLYVALPEWKETEGQDRSDLDLTPQQVALIRAVSAVQPQTIVVLNTGSAVVMSDWIEGTAAVLEAWTMGQAGGGAIADILFGVVNPSGRLAETFPRALEDTPAYLGFPGEGDVVRYGEGLFVGYRAYDARQQQVLFPFGYGLSYTTFEYSNPCLSAAAFQDIDGVTVSVDITNTGDVPGAEVVQVYVGDREASLHRPPKELKGFARVELAPGETGTVDVALDFRAFAFYHPGHRRWITEDGEFDLHIGASADDIRFVRTIRLTSSLELRVLLDERSTPAEWLADPRTRPTMAALLRELEPFLMPTFAEPLTPGEQPLELDDYLLGMPVRDVLEFASVLGGPDPETVIARLRSHR